MYSFRHDGPLMVSYCGRENQEVTDFNLLLGPNYIVSGQFSLFRDNTHCSATLKRWVCVSQATKLLRKFIWLKKGIQDVSGLSNREQCSTRENV